MSKGCGVNVTALKGTVAVIPTGWRKCDLWGAVAPLCVPTFIPAPSGAPSDAVVGRRDNI